MAAQREKRFLRNPHKVKFCASLAIGVMAMLVTVGCAQGQPSTSTPSGDATVETPRPGGVLDVAFAIEDPTDIDPLRAGAFQWTNLIGKTNNGLLQYDPIENTKIVPELAERWEISPDGKTYTLFLHKGVKWHDGVPFTAADVKYTLDRLRDPNDPKAVNFTSKRALLGPVDRVEIVDDVTVRLHLSRPSNSMLGVLAYGSMLIAPKHAYEQGVDMDKTAIGTGAFKMSEYQPNVIFRVVRNPDFFLKDRPYLDGINIYQLRDNATRTGAFLTGQIKLLWPIYARDVAQVTKDMPQAVVSTKSGLRNGMLAYQNEKPPFNDLRVRRAIDLALDRKAALGILVPGEGSLGTLLDPAFSQFTSDELSKLPGYRADKTQDLAEAKRLLTEAGYPDGFKTVIDASSQSDDYTELAVFGKDQLAKIGIQATLNIVQPTVHSTNRTTGNFDMIAVVGVLSFPDPIGGANYYGPGNFIRFKDPQFEELRVRQDTTFDAGERKQLIRQMEQRWLDQVPYSNLYWKTHSAVLHPEVRGYQTGVGLYDNQRFVDVWLAK